MRVGYVVNQYPSLSHSFIRREIAAVEMLGIEILRFAIRPSDAALIDPFDQAEAQLTEQILATPPWALFAAALAMIVARPRSSLQALALSWRMTRGFGRRIVRAAACWTEAAWLARRARQTRLNHFHAHFGTNSAAVARLAARMTGLPYSMTVHGPEEFDNVAALDLAGKVADAKFVVAISHFGRSQLCRLTPVAAWDKLHVVRCGLDLSQWATPVERPAPTVDLCFVGRLEPQKGLPILLDALALLAKRGRPLRLTAIGDGMLRDSIAQQCCDAGIVELVACVGARPNHEVRTMITHAKVMVVPSFAEGLPVVIMEALALGTPVIATSIAGIPELVDASCGRLVTAGDVDGLADAIVALLALETAQRAQLGAAGAQRVAQAHDIRTSARQLQALFGAGR